MKCLLSRSITFLFFLCTSSISLSQTIDVLYVANVTGDVQVVDVSNGHVVDVFKIDTLNPFWDAVDVAYDPVNEKLYTSCGNRHTILRCNQDGSVLEFIASTADTADPFFPFGGSGGNERLGFDIDTENNRIFFSGGTSGRLYRGVINGSNQSTILHTANFAVNGVAYDKTRDKIYFTDLFGGNEGIYSINPDGTGATLLFPGEEFRQVTVDETNGMLYWTDWLNQQILFGPVTGGSISVLVSGLSSRPYGIDIDPHNAKIYWTELNNDIYSLNMDGTGQMLLSNAAINPRGIEFGQYTVAPIPSLSQWTRVIFGLMMLIFGTVMVHNQRLSASST